MIEAVASAGSFLDGGGSKPLQRAAIPLLDDEHVVAETNAIHDGLPRRSATACSPGLERARRRASTAPPDGTFYVWGKVDGAAAAARRRHGLLPRRARRSKVIAVPGEFFDVNPGKRRSQRASRFRRHVRFSFGPAMDNLETALARLETLIDR